MMVVQPDSTPLLQHRRVDEFPNFIAAGDVVVLNDTRVVPARLFAEPKGAMSRPIEILLTRQAGPLLWECWAKPARRVRAGDTLRFSPALTAEVVSKSEQSFTLRFTIAGDEAAFWPEIEQIGVMPLPPYIRRETPRSEDKSDYQTVYARESGAIAAPTAGLHFTPEILEQIERRGAELVHVTLHVGIGTFAPVKVENIAEHRMHSERYSISDAAARSLNAARAEGRRVIAIGTTSVRTLESAVRERETIEAGSGETDIFITPGYQFRIVDAMLTNFHLPESTLLMLVSAFAGIETIRTAYREAVAEKYRFFSYGDCMFLAGRM
jgi:S-adenosylmethionine:tRNA ribosyltransferase-isomerase